MWALVNHLGLGDNWLPAFVSLIVVPALYVVLAIDAHKEYGDVIRASVDAKDVRTDHEKSKLLEEVADRLRVFDLEWWVVAAFGILIVTLMSCGYLTTWSNLDVGSTSAAIIGIYECQPISSGKLSCIAELGGDAAHVRTAMSLYATLVGLLVGFRLSWARLRLAQELKRYYVFHYRAHVPSVKRQVSRSS